MIRFVIALNVLVGAAIIFEGHASGQAANVEAGKKEGRVVVYGSVVPQAMEDFHKGFEAKYGIKVDYWRADSTKVSERALTEWRAGKPGFDVVEGNRGVQLIMKQEGLFNKEKWLDLVRGLARQRPVLVDSLAPVTTAVIKGEAPVGITYIKYVKQYKGPVHYVLMDKYLADPNYMSVGVKAPNANAAKLYVDYACSPEGQKHIAEDGEFVFA